jgi:hypothetical protein
MDTRVLGAVVRDHRGQWNGEIVPLAVACGLLALPAFGILAMPAQRPLLAPLGFVFGVIAAVILIQTARDATMVVTVHERGISWSRGRASGAFAFADVTAITAFRSAIRATKLPATGYRISTKRGDVRIPASLSELPALLSSLSGNVPPAALPNARAL